MYFEFEPKNEFGREMPIMSFAKKTSGSPDVRKRKIQRFWDDLQQICDRDCYMSGFFFNHVNYSIAEINKHVLKRTPIRYYDSRSTQTDLEELSAKDVLDYLGQFFHPEEWSIVENKLLKPGVEWE